MAVKVIMERTVSSDNQGELAELLKELRAKAIHQPGYVSGETLFSVDRPGTHLVISTWESLRDWHYWEQNAERTDLAKKVEDLLSEPSRVSVYATTPRGIAEGI